MNYRDTQRLVDSGFVPKEVLVEYSKNVHMICEAYVRGDITHEQKEELMLENKRNFFSKKSDEKWKYKVDLIDDSVFAEIEKKYGVKISSGFKRFIKKYNGATPVNYKVKVGEKDRVVGAILSFNKNEKDADSAFLALDGLKGTGLLPFAIDPFGNYFCIKDGKVVFWNHETNEITETGKSLSKFASDLNSNTMTESVDTLAPQKKTNATNVETVSADYDSFIDELIMDLSNDSVMDDLKKLNIDSSVIRSQIVYSLQKAGITRESFKQIPSKVPAEEMRKLRTSVRLGLEKKFIDPHKNDDYIKMEEIRDKKELKKHNKSLKKEEKRKQKEERL